MRTSLQKVNFYLDFVGRILMVLVVLVLSWWFAEQWVAYRAHTRAAAIEATQEPLSGFTVPTAVSFHVKNYEVVGSIRWDDTDGDGKPNFRWEGTDIEESAKLFLKHLTDCECVCGNGGK